jgi:protein-L-isoaspartate(D-aspartate) O-methyltransferase
MKKLNKLTVFILLTVCVFVFASPSKKFLASKRNQMINLFKSIGLNNQNMLDAFKSLNRENFAYNRKNGSYKNSSQAYNDYPLPIGYGQTISSPRMMAIMTHYLKLKPGHKVLEIGTGSGYQAAVLSKLAKKIYTIEIVGPLGKAATPLFKKEGLLNIENKVADGYFGWEEHAPFDRIIVTCATNHVPPKLLKQLKRGGILIVPVGHPYRTQMLKIITKTESGKIKVKNLLKVKFVPMTGKAMRRR